MLVFALDGRLEPVAEGLDFLLARLPPARALCSGCQLDHGGLGGPIKRLEPVSARPFEVGRGPVLVYALDGRHEPFAEIEFVCGGI